MRYALHVVYHLLGGLHLSWRMHTCQVFITHKIKKNLTDINRYLRVMYYAYAEGTPSFGGVNFRVRAIHLISTNPDVYTIITLPFHGCIVIII